MNLHLSPATEIARAWPTGPAEFSNVIFSAEKSEAFIKAVAELKVPISLPSSSCILAYLPFVIMVSLAESPMKLMNGLDAGTVTISL